MRLAKKQVGSIVFGNGLDDTWLSLLEEHGIEVEIKKQCFAKGAPETRPDLYATARNSQGRVAMDVIWLDGLYGVNIICRTPLERNRTLAREIERIFAEHGGKIEVSFWET